VGQIPVHAEVRAGGDRAMFYRDYIDSPTSPLFPFGHGLSYTTFEYGELQVEAGTTRDSVRVTVEVTNSGERAGTDVVQLYMRDEVASVARPVQQLIGFARVTLQPGERRTLHFTVHPSRLAFYDAAMRFVVEPGDFTFRVGSSSGDIRAEETVGLQGAVVEYRQREITATECAVG
jgi:beta-glucosidase